MSAPAYTLARLQQSVTNLPPRTLIAIVSVAFWIIATLVQTGSGGVIAIWTGALFMIELIVLSSATRTISIGAMATIFCAGGFMFGLAVLGGNALLLLDPDRNALLRKFTVPILEESLKLLPVLYYLWRGRKKDTWAMGMTDVMLLATACGAGFSLLEDAHILTHGNVNRLAWLPTTNILGAHMIASHAIWTGLAGATIGLALLLRSRGIIALPIAASGYCWAILDHTQNNYRVSIRNFFGNALGGVTADGWMSVYLFVIAGLVAIAFDLYIIHGTLPKIPLKLSLTGGLDGLSSAWRFITNKRAFAFLAYQYRRASGSARTQIETIALEIAEEMIEETKSSSAARQPAQPVQV
jgi:RsiW-degrading membrane proteinase PrsW (M82 family)